MRACLFAVVLALGCAVSPDSICDDANNPCASGYSCVQGVCQAATSGGASCTDHVLNGTESDVDCGGSCPRCGATLLCRTGADCASSLCADNHCACPAGQHVDGTSCTRDVDTACGSPPVDCTHVFANGTGGCAPSTPNAPAACVLAACNSGFHPQDGICVSDATTACAGVDCTDAAHQDPHGTMTCAAGGCAVAACQQGFHPNSSSTACDASSLTCCGPGPGCRDCTTAFANGSGTCAIGASTPNGACSLTTCAAGFHVDTASNSCVANVDTSCGSPPVDCTRIANAIATCDVQAGTCTVTCNSGFHAFNGGCEQNTDTVCGAGRVNCTTQFLPNGTGACDATAGTCHLTACFGAFHVCSGSCASNNSVNSCGSSCSACPTDPLGTATCDGTSCGLTCQTGTHDCGTGTCQADSNDACGRLCIACDTGLGYNCVQGGCRCTLPFPMQCQ